MPIHCECILLCSAVNLVSKTSLQRASLPLPVPGDVLKITGKVPQAQASTSLGHVFPEEHLLQSRIKVTFHLSSPLRCALKILTPRKTGLEVGAEGHQILC